MKQITEKEENALEIIAQALPHMSDLKKGELLGYAKAMVDLKKEREDEIKPAC